MPRCGIHQNSEHHVPACPPQRYDPQRLDMAGKYAAQGSAMCTNCDAGMYKAFLMPSFDARQGPFRTRAITGIVKEWAVDTEISLQARALPLDLTPLTTASHVLLASLLLLEVCARINALQARPNMHKGCGCCKGVLYTRATNLYHACHAPDAADARLRAVNIAQSV